MQGQGQGPSLQGPGQGQGLDLQGQGQRLDSQGPGQEQGLVLKESLRTRTRTRINITAYMFRAAAVLRKLINTEVYSNKMQYSKAKAD